MTMTALHGASGAVQCEPVVPRHGPWEGLPPLATCSYGKYRRPMGTAVRITRMALRGVRLPDPRYTDREHWPVIRDLIPGRDIFHRSLPPREFASRYCSTLDLIGMRLICKQIGDIRLDPEPAVQRLVLLCYEDVTGNPLVCHRRAFAGWWAAQTGMEVPELG